MNTLCDILDTLREADRSDLLWVRPPGAEAFRPVPARGFLDDIEQCAHGLRALGVGSGDRVGVVVRNCPEWHVIDFACHRLGAIVVPLFASLAASQVAYCFGDAGCKVAFVGDTEQLDKLLGVRGRLPDLDTVILVDAPADGAESLADLAFERLLELGRGRADDVNDDAALPGPDGSDAVATVIYTSGTTGPPKGAMLTHRNLIANVEAVSARVPPRSSDVCLSLLPLCHVFERTADYIYFSSGCSIAYSSPATVGEDFRLVRPHVLIGVPRLYEKLRESVEARVASARPPMRRAFEIAFRLGMKRARAELADDRITLLERALHRLADWLILRRVREGFGGRIRYLVSGGAALDPRINWWYEAVGMRLVQGYGLTESAPVLTANSLVANRVGTVGPPLHNVDVRIAEDGEILVRGPSIMAGYWNRPDETATRIIEGWLHTGDIGRLDGDGFLLVTDRKKQILVTSTGKNVSPQMVEHAISASPYVDQVLVVGDGRRFLSGLIVPSYARIAVWAAAKGIEGDAEALCRDPRIVGLVRTELERVQSDLAPYERVREFRLLPDGFTVDNGMMTPTLKLVRHRVLERYATCIEEIYRS